MDGDNNLNAKNQNNPGPALPNLPINNEDEDYDSDSSDSSSASLHNMPPMAQLNWLAANIPMYPGPLHLHPPPPLPPSVENGRRAPPSLLSASIASAVSHSAYRPRLHLLPPPLQMRVYEELFRRGRLCQLGYELCDLRLFDVLLGVTERRPQLHQMMQAVMDHGLLLAQTLAESFAQRLPYAQPSDALPLGFRLARFLGEAGWFAWAELVFRRLPELVVAQPCLPPLTRALRLLEAHFRLLECRNGFCLLDEAKESAAACRALIPKVQKLLREQPAESKPIVELADVYAQFSVLAFNHSQFTEATEMAIQALREITAATPLKTVMHVFRQAGKVLVVKRQFGAAGLLMEQAVGIAKHHFDGGRRCPELLIDYGFYLINLDLSEAAAQMQQMGLEMRREQLGPAAVSLRMAQAHEELAYALYVHEYSNGSFRGARLHAEEAIRILAAILPPTHLLLASSKRVKALILEEIAIDSADAELKRTLLQEAESLHLSALHLSERLFGEQNLQTAKHFGNLGRLFQSMQRFDEAETMHRKAIAIKTSLLGERDYEVALSMGHLASLYAYDMERWAEAEQLYLASIAIGEQLLGPAYSGLEYDFRGLIHCYHSLGQAADAAQYTASFQTWKGLRDAEVQRQRPEVLWSALKEPRPTMDVLKEFFASSIF